MLNLKTARPLRGRVKQDAQHQKARVSVLNVEVRNAQIEGQNNLAYLFSVFAKIFLPLGLFDRPNARQHWRHAGCQASLCILYRHRAVRGPWWRNDCHLQAAQVIPAAIRRKL